MSELIDLKNIRWEELLPSIPEKSVDLLYTDPPYGCDFQSGGRKEKYKKIEGDKDLSWVPSWVQNIYRVMKPGAHLYIWCSWHKVDIWKQELERYYSIKNIIVWDKGGGGMGDLKGGYGSVHEFCIFINTGKDLNGSRDSDVLDRAYRTGNVYHPTQKPVTMARYFILKSSQPGDLVLDCFSGSGSAAIACHKTGRRFVGRELDKDFYELSMKHIEVETSQTELF